jgi:hypothetical protein
MRRASLMAIQRRSSSSVLRWHAQLAAQLLLVARLEAVLPDAVVGEVGRAVGVHRRHDALL